MGRGRRDKVHLTVAQRESFEQISRNGYAPAKKILHARILLLCDEGEQAKRKWTDEEIGEALQIHRNTVGRIRQRFLQKGEKPALNRQRRITPPTPPKVDGATEAQIIALCCSDPPEGRKEWTIRLLTSQLKQRQIITEISRETVRRTLTKNQLRPWKEDYHYSREGVQALFMFFDPHRGWRRVSNRDSRTRLDWAEEIRQLLDVDYPNARKIKLVCDNLNTHNIASLYEAFPAPEAHRLARKLEIYHTPRNGSWLNVAEMELSVLSKQCLERRIPTVEELNREIKAWQKERNQTASKVIWRFTTEEARVKLKHLYPVFEEEKSSETNASF